MLLSLVVRMREHAHYNASIVNFICTIQYNKLRKLIEPVTLLSTLKKYDFNIYLIIIQNNTATLLASI